MSKPRILGLVLTWVSLTLLTSTALAQSRRAPAPTVWDRELTRFYGEVVRQGRRPEGAIPLIELGSRWEMGPERATALMHQLGGDRRLSPTLRVYAQLYEILFLRRSGRSAEADAIADRLGFVRRWRILGPFSNEGRRGFTEPTPPEQALDAPTDLGAEYQGTERPIRWRIPPDLGPIDSLPLGSLVTPATNACVLAETFVELDHAGPVALFVGAAGASRVYWNGRQALEDPVYHRQLEADRAATMVHGRAGWNRVLLKVCGSDQELGVLFRVAARDGSPMRTRVDPEATMAAPSGAEPAAGAPPETLLASLEAAVAARPTDAAAHETLARYLAYTGADDAEQSRVLDLANRAVELRETKDNRIFAARQQRTRADRMRHVLGAVALAPNDPEVRVEHALLVASGAGGERALSMLEAIEPTTTHGLRAMLVRASLLDNLELDRSANALREEMLRRVPGSPFYLRVLADSEAARGHVTRATELRRQLLGIRRDDSAVRRYLAELAIRRTDRDAAATLIAEELAHFPGSTRTMYWAAAMYDAIGQETEALGAIQSAVEIDPDDATSHIAHGRYLLRIERQDAALAALRTALALRPQDAATRLLIERIQPEARPDEAYATPIETIVARRRPDGQWPFSTLHDIEVHTIHDNGLSSRFRQLVVQIHDREGARANRAHAIQFEPATQWVDIRAVRVYRGDNVLTAYRTGQRSLAEPAYRIYYSARELVVSFPQLEPGDIVELRYRVEDIAARNEYAGYYGTTRGLQGYAPTAHLEHVFITPASMQLFVNEPSLSLEHTQEVRGAERVHRFVAEDVPPLRPEPEMPGYMEVAPYLHVSTYPSWQDVGRFFWGLVRSQIEPDASLEQTVRTLVEGAPDTRTKVQRIYAWATDHVRYVGLEFGIHGHQPYRVTDVVRRGFGDCKDTAALLYAMLRLAGVDARIALVRTRPRGEIEGSPASLSVFDHAIAYVPELDLYLDGTAEHAGITELPAMDQNGMALVVGPDSAELTHLPIRDADQNGRRRDLTVRLAADGGATLAATEEVQGDDAMRARGTYEPAGTRRERLTRVLGGLFTGIELDRESFDGIQDREREVRYTWGGHVPRMGERQGDRLRIAPSVLGGLTSSWATLPTRRYPLVLGVPFHYRERRAVEVGPLQTIEVPAGGTVESEFGRASVRYERSNAQVVAQTELRVTHERVSPDDYPRFRAWVERVDALLGERMVFGGVR